MTTSYRYHAFRADDGTTLSSGTVEDILDQGMGIVGMTIKQGLIDSHPLAEGLEMEDIDIEMSYITLNE